MNEEDGRYTTFTITIEAPVDVRFYCEGCGESRAVIIEDLQSDDLNGDRVWGDIICRECRLVIATVSADSPGRYRFMKMDASGSARLEIDSER